MAMLRRFVTKRAFSTSLSQHAPLVEEASSIILDPKEDLREKLVARTAQLKDLELRYAKLQQMMEFKEETQLEYQP